MELNGISDNDFIPEMLNLNYELIRTEGKLNGSRYRCYNKRTRKITGSSKDEQPYTK